MKNCAHFRLLISRYMDNDLSGVERKEVDTHVASCLDCQKTATSYISIRGLLAESFEISSVQVSASTVGKLVFAKSPARFTWRWEMRLAAILIIGIALFAGNRLLTHRSLKTTPVVLQEESRPIMNSPLGTLVYYEKLAGSTVHAQFTNIQSKSKTTFSTATSARSQSLSYVSPLFGDNTILSYRDEVALNW